MKRLAFLFICILFVSCSNNPEQYIDYISGYWEIQEVEKDNKILKEYKISTSIDYFEINDDLTGFRKKVAPTLEGKYIVTHHSWPFILKVENDSLNIYYQVNMTTFKETIKQASKTELIIINTEGFKYTYKPFEKFDLDL